MKKFYLITNGIKDPDLAMTLMVADYLTEQGAECIVEGLTKAGGERSTSYRKKHLDKDTDCIIVLGGDGTVLEAAGKVLDLDIPLVGLNLGTLGYLAEVERSNWKEAMDALLSGRYEIEERMMLEASFGRHKHFALNDVVFQRCGNLRILNYDVYVNGQFLNSVNADGLILSTPTGSTAYNLSAGGPIVEPGARMILLTPICAHTLNTRTIVLSPEDEIVIEIGHTSKEADLEAMATFDGSQNLLLHTKDRVKIKRSDTVTKLIRINKRSFLETLHRKMAN